MRLAMFTAAGLMLAAVGGAQQDQWDVASVKPHAGLGNGSNFNLQPGGGLNCINVTLKEMILFAYNIREQQLTGASGWMENDRYDVYAKGAKDDDPAGAKQSFEESLRGRRVRMRSLLADRFRLEAHSETRELPIYALVVAKGGPRLKESTAEGLTIHNQKGRFECKKVTMKLFAENSLTNRLGRTVVDKTGLTGEYDFDVKYVEEQAAAADVSGPDLLTALKEQLGLQLESRKGPVEVLVVDRAEKAAAN